MNRYLRVVSHYELGSDPSELIIEVDNNNMELRRIEYFQNGIIGLASEDISVNGAVLGHLPVPELSEILSDPVFTGNEIDKDEFERLWNSAQKNSEEKE